MAKRAPSQVERAKRAVIQMLAGEAGFVGAGVSKNASGQVEILVLVTDDQSPVLSKVPSEWEGIPVRTQIGGVPKKLSPP